MPYFIAKDRVGCESGWAVVDEAGDILGCHGDKQSAIDQAVAVSIATEEPFQGERAAIGELVPGDYVQWIAGGEAYFGEVYQVDGETAQVKIYDEENGIYIESVLLAVVPVADLTKITDLPTVEPDMEEDRDLPDNYRPALADDVPEGRACGNCFFYDESRVNADGDGCMGACGVCTQMGSSACTRTLDASPPTASATSRAIAFISWWSSGWMSAKSMSSNNCSRTSSASFSSCS